MNLRLEKKATASVLASAIFYGFMGFFGTKILQSGFPLPALLFYRFLGAGLFCFAFHCFFEKYKPEQEKPCTKYQKHGILKKYFFPVLWGFLFYSLSELFYFKSSKSVGTGIAMVIFFVFPVIVTILSMLFSKLTLKPIYIVSFVVIFFGLVLIASPDVHGGQLNFKGVLYGLLCATSYSFYVVFSQKTSTFAPPLLQTACVCFGSALFYAIYCFHFHQMYLPHSTRIIFLTVMFCFFCTALPTFLMMYGLKYIDATRASLISVLQPVICVTAGMFFLNENLTLKICFGIAVIILGSLCVMMPAETLKKYIQLSSFKTKSSSELRRFVSHARSFYVQGQKSKWIYSAIQPVKYLSNLSYIPGFYACSKVSMSYPKSRRKVRCGPEIFY